MATIRWCPIFPKWDIYQPLIVPLNLCFVFNLVAKRFWGRAMIAMDWRGTWGREFDGCHLRSNAGGHSLEIAQLLIDARADVNKSSRPRGLHYLFHRACQSYMRYLTSNPPVSIKICAEITTTPLGKACFLGDLIKRETRAPSRLENKMNNSTIGMSWVQGEKSPIGIHGLVISIGLLGLFSTFSAECSKHSKRSLPWLNRIVEGKLLPQTLDLNHSREVSWSSMLLTQSMSWEDNWIIMKTQRERERDIYIYTLKKKT